MKTMIFLMVAMVLTGCGRGTIQPGIDHGVFEPYFQRFETYSREQGRDTEGDASIVIEFGIDGEAEGGKCFRSSMTTRTIKIKASSWDGINDVQKESLILHELGHCLLNREHRLDKDPKGYPVSLMYPNIVIFYSETKDGYIKELFADR